MSIAKDVWTGGGGSGGFRGVSEVSTEPPLGCMHLVLRSTDDRLNGTPLALATELRKLLLWLTLACFRRKYQSIGLVGLVVALKRLENGHGFSRKWAWLLKFHEHISRAKYIIQNSPSRNPRSATVRSGYRL